MQFRKKAKSIVKKTLKWIGNNKVLVILIITTSVFSLLLMFSAFYVQDDHLHIAGKSFSDFLSHIPLIRSFSMGDNFPVEFPYFPGEPIKYHFLFYAVVGLIEKLGVRIDIALNVMSAIGLVGLLITIYLLAKKISKSKFVGVGALLLVIFNSSLSWIYYFFIGENVVSNPLDILKQTELGGFGPYHDTIISAFWNLNVFTNQRHLALSFFLALLAIWLVVYKKKKWQFIIAIIIIGLMAWIHKATLLIIFLCLTVFFVVDIKNRRKVLLTMALGLFAAAPGLLYLSQTNLTDSAFLSFRPGFLFEASTWWEMSSIHSDFVKWVIYWIMNAGLLPILAFAGFIVSCFDSLSSSGRKLDRLIKAIFNLKTVWYLIASASFIAANIFAFGTDIANNHKLINFTLIIWGIYAFIFLNEIIKNYKSKFKYLIVGLIILGLYFGGICDVFPIFNDGNYPLPDFYSTEKGNWVANNTNPQDVFLNFSEENLFVLLTGRKVFYGGRYFNWSLGYPQYDRDGELGDLIKSDYDKDLLCQKVANENIKYIYLNKDEEKVFDFVINQDKFIEKYGEGLLLDNVTMMYNASDICR